MEAEQKHAALAYNQYSFFFFFFETLQSVFCSSFFCKNELGFTDALAKG